VHVVNEKIVRIHVNFSWLYNLFDGIIASNIKDSINDQVKKLPFSVFFPLFVSTKAIILSLSYFNQTDKINVAIHIILLLYAAGV
jgi:hypothetical protein